jgi:predicted RNA methylase
MAIEDAFGVDPLDQVNTQLAERAPSLAQSPRPIDPIDAVNALYREMQRPKPPAAGAPGSVKPDFYHSTRAENDPDLFYKGTREPVPEEPPPPVEKPAPAPPSGSITEGASVGARALGQAAVTGTGAAIKGVGELTSPKPVPPGASGLIDDIANVQSDQDRIALMKRATQSLPKAMALDFNAALQRIGSGADPAAETDKLRKSFGDWNANVATPPDQGALGRAGEAVKQFGKTNIPVSEAERAKYPITSQVGSIVGGALPAVAAGAAATALGGPVAGIGAGAGVIGAQSAGDEFDRARAAIDSQIDEATKADKPELAAQLLATRDERAAHAAGMSAVVNTALGALPIGMILRPVQQVAPGLTGKVWAILDHAVKSGVTFAGVGEAQQYVGEQLAKEYDPKAHYDFDFKRLVAEFLGGAVLGGGHTAIDLATRGGAAQPQPGAQPQTGQAGLPPPATGAAGAAGAAGGGPQPGVGPGGAGAGGRAHAGNYTGGPRGPGEPPGPGESWGTWTYTGDNPDGTAGQWYWNGSGPGAGAGTGPRSGAGGGPTGGTGAPPGPSRGEQWQAEWTKTPPPDAAQTARMDRTGIRDTFKAAYGFTDEDLRNASMTDLRAFANNADFLQAHGFKPADIAKMGPADMAAEVERVHASNVDDILRRAGVSDEDIAKMSPEEKQRTAAEARAQGTHAGPEAAPGTREKPVDVETPEDVATAAAQADQQGTPAQHEANNVQRGHARWNGLDITIEAPAGGVRRGTAPDGTPFETTHPHAYGYVRGVPSAADGQAPDITIGPNPQAPNAYVIDEIDPKTRKYRQSKSFAGFDSAQAARAAYLGISSKDESHIGGMTAVPRDEFVEMARAGDLARPLARLRRTAAPTTSSSGITLRHVPEASYHDLDLHDIVGPDGKLLGTITVATTDPKRIEVEGATVAGGSNTLGPRVVKDVLKQLREIYPDATSVAGERISGARAKANSPNKRASVALPEHVAAIKQVITSVGEDPKHLEPPDLVQRAAEMHAGGMSPADAFQAALIKSAVEHGVLTEEQAKGIYGNQISALLSAEPAPERVVHAPAPGATTRGAHAADQELGAGVQRGGEDLEGGTKAKRGENAQAGGAERAEPVTGGRRGETAATGHPAGGRGATDHATGRERPAPAAERRPAGEAGPGGETAAADWTAGPAEGAVAEKKESPVDRHARAIFDAYQEGGATAAQEMLDKITAEHKLKVFEHAVLTDKFRALLSDAAAAKYTPEEAAAAYDKANLELIEIREKIARATKQGRQEPQNPIGQKILAKLRTRAAEAQAIMAETKDLRAPKKTAPKSDEIGHRPTLATAPTGEMPELPENLRRPRKPAAEEDLVAELSRTPSDQMSLDDLESAIEKLSDAMAKTFHEGKPDRKIEDTLNRLLQEHERRVMGVLHGGKSMEPQKPAAGSPQAQHPGLVVTSLETGKTKHIKVSGAPQFEPETPPIARSLKTLLAGDKPITNKVLHDAAAKAYGGTLAEGKFDRKDMYDALELAVNMRVKEDPDLHVGLAPGWERQVQQLEKLLKRLPTQTVRSEEQIRFQQFSTPPHYALAVAYAAAVRDGDTVLEPSAGTGSLLAAAERPGVKMVANELSDRRAEMLKALLGPEGRVFQENAEQLDNILPADVKPTVVVMNPPFSQTAGRMGDKKVIETGANHISQALNRLEPGGRLVAIVGRGMSMDAPRFRKWWADVSGQYAVRANIGVDGSVYAKYGTNFGTRLLVIDKVPPTGEPPITAEARTVDDLMRTLEPIRNGRPETLRTAAEQQPAQSAGAEMAAGGEGARPAPSPLPVQPGAMGPGQRGGRPVAEPGPSGDRGAGGPSVRVEAGERPGVAPVEPGGSAGGEPGAGAQPDHGTSIGGEPAGGGGAGAERGVQPPAGGEPGTAAERLEVEQAAPGSQTRSEISDSLYEPYAPQRLRVAGAKKHPGPLVQSAAMASVEPPAPTYSPAIPKNVITDGLLSLPQLEAVVYAGQAHQRMLPAAEGETARRGGFFIGDGTGVGKGREIAGIILDNWQQGRTKAIWVSEKKKLLNDAKRDWSGLGQNPSHLFEIGKVKAGEPVKAERGIGFVTYDTLKGGLSDQAALAQGGFVRGQRVTVEHEGPGTVASSKLGGTKLSPTWRVKLDNGQTVNAGRYFMTPIEGGTASIKSRVDQIVDWFGKDFDGVIAFDESHNMGNAVAMKGDRGVKDAAQKALAGLLLQERLPNARIVYVSATGATEVSNLAYAERLGLWGRGTPFADRTKFVNEVEGGGIAAMELVARDMKQLGRYIARNLSYDGVEYDRLEHRLDPAQREIYDTVATAWQHVLQNIEKALELTKGDRDRNAKSAAKSAFWGAHQRFFNQIITSLQMPSVVKAVEKDLKAGRQAVLQLTNTNEASQERAAAKAESAEEIEDLDITPRDQIIQLIEKSFPTQQYEQYVDENGNISTRPVMDRDGNPVQNKEAVAMRDRLIDQLASIRVPQGPLDMVLDHFGVDTVAEVTGRGRRFVMKEDDKGRVKRTEESRPASANQSEIDAFQAGKKRVLVFSEAGGTGASYHADNGSPSKGARRSHYLVQAGWRADKAVQGFGRTHRTNQASAPIFHLVTTDLDGQRRFISSIARRLGQLGALTKGQRQAGDQGIFTARDNLESTEARDALQQFFTDLMNREIKGLNPVEFERQTGLSLHERDKEGNIVGTKANMPPITQFLNRLLSMKIAQQNAAFQAFSDRLDAVIEARQAAGVLDAGLETVRADKITKQEDKTVHVSEESGAETKYVKLELANRFHPTPFKVVEGSKRRPLQFWAKSPNGKVYGISEAPHLTDTASGQVIEQYRATGPASTRFIPRIAVHGYQSKWERIDRSDALRLWKDEIDKAPEFTTRDLHLITGAILPIWDRVKGSTRVVRTQTDEGEQLLGRVVSSRDIGATLRALGADAGAQKVDAPALFARLMGGSPATLANGWTLRRSRVAGESRIELVGPSTWSEGEEVKKDGVFTERIQYATRYFVPTSEAEGVKTLASLIEHRPVVEMGEGETPPEDDEQQFGLASPTNPFVEPPPRSHGFPASAREPVADFRTDAEMKRHPDYAAAKAGDNEAAIRMVRDLVKPENLEAARQRFGPDAVYVPVIAEERTGRNAIPWTLAERYAQATGARTTTDIIQANRAFHTGAGPMERLAVRAVFSGNVQRGGRYVIVDDASVMGSTLADLADHIQRNGGEVAGVVLLVNASRTGVLTPTKGTLRDVERRHGDAIRDLFHVSPAGLTADEAAYLRNFRDADELRTSLAKAQRARGERLGSKGVREQDGGVGFAENGPPEAGFLGTFGSTDAIRDRLAPGMVAPHGDRGSADHGGGTGPPPRRGPVDTGLAEPPRDLTEAPETGPSDSGVRFSFHDLGPFPVDPTQPLGRQAQAYVRERGRETGLEHILLVDKAGNVITHGHGTRGGVTFDARGDAAISDPHQQIVVHHNHPSDEGLSIPDIAMLGAPGLSAIWAHGHGGSAARAALTPRARAALSEMDWHDARRGLDQTMSAVGDSLRPPMQAAVDARLITTDQATRAYYHVIADVMRRAGVIDHLKNHDSGTARVIAAVHLEPYMQQAADLIAGSFFNERADSLRNDRRAEPLRHPGDVGASFGGRTEITAGGREPWQPDRQGREDPGGAAGEPEGLRASGFAEGDEGRPVARRPIRPDLDSRRYFKGVLSDEESRQYDRDLRNGALSEASRYDWWEKREIDPRELWDDLGEIMAPVNVGSTPSIIRWHGKDIIHGGDGTLAYYVQTGRTSVDVNYFDFDNVKNLPRNEKTDFWEMRRTEPNTGEVEFTLYDEETDEESPLEKFKGTVEEIEARREELQDKHTDKSVHYDEDDLPDENDRVLEHHVFMGTETEAEQHVEELSAGGENWIFDFAGQDEHGKYRGPAPKDDAVWERVSKRIDQSGDERLDAHFRAVLDDVARGGTFADAMAHYGTPKLAEMFGGRWIPKDEGPGFAEDTEPRFTTPEDKGRIAPDVGKTQRSGFYFRAGRKLAEVPDALFPQGGWAVINWLRQAGVPQAEINHFQLAEKLGNKRSVTRAEFADAIRERMFDFQRKLSRVNPERSSAKYDLGGTRAFGGPRIPGRGTYFERLMRFPKKLAGGEEFAPGNFESSHWQWTFPGTWASWRGSIRDIPDWGRTVIGEEGQSDYMQGARSDRRPRVEGKTFLAMRAERKNYERAMSDARHLLSGALMQAGLYEWDYRRGIFGHLIPIENKQEHTLPDWMDWIGQARDAISQAPAGRYVTEEYAAKRRVEAQREIDKLVALRRANERYFEPGAYKKFAKTESSFTPETPIDQSYVRTMVRDLILHAAKEKADAIAISTSTTTIRIQNSPGAAHFYNQQLKPALERELRRLTGDGSLKLKLVYLPKALGAPKREKPYTVYAAKLPESARQRALGEGLGFFEGGNVFTPPADEGPGFAAPGPVFTPPPASALRQRISDLLDSAAGVRVIEGLYDLSHRVALLRDEVRARMTGTLPDSQDFYTRKRLYPGRVASATHEFDVKHLDPLVKFLKSNKISLDEAGAYLYARHAPERNAAINRINPALGGAGSGMTDLEARAIVDNAHRANEPAYRELARRVAAMRERTLQFMEWSGLEKPATIATWRGQYSDYVPLKGWEIDPPDAPQRQGGGVGFNVRGRETQQAFGRRSRADNPLVNVIEQAYRTVERGEKNRYLQTLYRALDALGPADARDIGTLDRGKPRREIDPRTGLVRSVETSTSIGNPNAVDLKIAGEPHFIVFRDQQLADAVTRLSPDGSAALQFVLRLQNKLKAIWTHYSPDFLARHFLFRYPIEGTLNSFEQKEGGNHSITRYVKEGAPFIGTATRAIFASNKGARMDSAEGRELQDYWNEMRKAGGAMMFRNMRDIDMMRDHLKMQLMALSGRPVAKIREKWRRGIEAMDTVTNALDNALRLAAYASARRQGKTADQAALIAREATVDFSLKGKWSNIVGIWFPFANVANQTAARLVKAVGRSRMMRRVLWGTIGAGFLIAAFNYLVGGDDKDGVPFFDKLPEWDKRLNIIILNPFTKDSEGRPQPIKIPMPYNWAMPLTLGYGFGNATFGSMKLGKAIAMVTHSLIEGLTPLGNEENLAALPVPELLRPLAHVASNKDTFGRPVHADPAFTHGPAAESPLRGRRTAGPGYQALASGVNRATGGSKTTSGLIDMYPEDYRELLGYLISTPLREIAEVTGPVQSVAKGERPDPTQTLGVRVVFGADYDAADRARLGEQRHAITHPWESGATPQDVQKWRRDSLGSLNAEAKRVNEDKSLSVEERRDQMADIRRRQASVARTADQAAAQMAKRAGAERASAKPSAGSTWRPPPLPPGVYDKDRIYVPPGETISPEERRAIINQ